MKTLDTCIITASNPAQAAVFRTLVCTRIEAALYPREIEFFVTCDPPGGRIGSGGGSLWALSQYAEHAGFSLEHPESGHLGGRSILIINAGGESRRLPAYSAEGKLFAPLPSPSSSLVPPIVLDHTLRLFISYPWRPDELVITSGDALVSFDTGSLALGSDAIHGFGAAESFERGSHHGVFAFDFIANTVTDYFQKATIEELETHAKLEGHDACAVDLGIVSLYGQGIKALSTLATSRYEGCSILEHISQGRCGFDLYLEILMACIPYLNCGEYKMRLEKMSTLPDEIKDIIWNAFNPCGLAATLVDDPVFIHFGDVREFPEACLELKNREIMPFYSRGVEELVPVINADKIEVHCSNLKADRCDGLSYFELCRDVSVEQASGLFMVDVQNLELKGAVPQGLCIEQRRAGTAEYTLVYCKSDTFKLTTGYANLIYMGMPITEWLQVRGLALDDVFLPDDLPDIYSARLFACDCDSDFIQGYWQNMGSAWTARFKAAARLSLRETSRLVDAATRDDARAQVRMVQLGVRLEKQGFFNISGIDLKRLLRSGFDPAPLVARCAHTKDPVLKQYRQTVLAEAGVLSTSESGKVILAESHGPQHTLRISVLDDQIVWAHAPVRLDIAGGWTDTPPYTNRYGGVVLNIAVELNGQDPLQVFVRKTQDLHLRLYSIDQGRGMEYSRLNEIRDIGNPADLFAIAKSALVFLGFGRGLADNESVRTVLEKIGGGIELSILSAVPKGSGLGTSSILAGVVLAALARFFGVRFSSSDVFRAVLTIEQMMTTGGGWQDQIGGLAGGVKYIVSKPGLKPEFIIHQLDPWIFEAKATRQLMTLYYSGTTRLARNILSDVVTRVNCMERAYLFTHDRIAHLASAGRDAISLRDYPALAQVIKTAFAENKLIHASTTNPELDALVRDAMKYCIGLKFLGAGGGGYMLMASRDEKNADALREMLVKRATDNKARLVDFELDNQGLQVTLS